VPVSLTTTLLESHAAASGRGRALGAGSWLAIRPDHLVLEGHAATLALLAFESLARPRAPLDAVLVADGAGEGGGRFEAADERLYRRAASRRAGAAFARPESGPAHQLYLARFASPGRVVFAAAHGVSVAGALGSLVLPAGPIEVAAALAGAPVPRLVPPIVGVRLRGTLPWWAGGHDLVCALALRLAEAGLAGGVLEFEGSGVEALPIPERCAVARAVDTLGMVACLFPSDERTREWLRTCGREPDWKLHATALEPDAAAMIEVDLDAIEPMRRASGTGAIRPLRDSAGNGFREPIAQAVVGPDADIADLLKFAAMLGGRTPAAGVAVIAHAGTHAIATALERSGARAMLAAAGVQVLSPGARPVARPPRGASILCGVDLPGGWGDRASVATVAACAISGRISDPREVFEGSIGEIEVDGFTPDEPWISRPAVDAPTADPGLPARTVQALPESPPLTTALRGPVLIALGERVAARRILPEGPRVWRHASHIAALARHAFAEADPAFVARARAARGGFVVAAGGFGEGARDPHAALALVELGVRAVLARSFAPGCVASLVRHGILPLVFAVPDDTEILSTGDEIEVPGLPETLEPNKPLVVRDLTRGGQVLVHHELGAREIEMVRVGGLLQAVRAAGAAPSVGVARTVAV
jgi:aconitate hydratase